MSGPHGRVIRSAGLYEKDCKYILAAYSQDRDGLWIEQEPVAVLDADAPAAEVGGAALRMLGLSRTGIAPRSDPKGASSPSMRAAGFSSYSSFMKTARSIDIREHEAEGLAIIPTRNGGRRDGYTQMTEKTRFTERNPAAVGAAIHAALADCA